MNNAASVIATVEDARIAPRTHLFVSATLGWDGEAVSVNVRNMSQTGALIESPVIPDVGTAVLLRRGSLEIGGRIAWKADRKGGVAFCSYVHVADWMPRKPAAGQERVDRIVSDFKAGKLAGGLVAGTAATPNGNSLAMELQALRAELRELGNSLIGDVILVATHPEIQTLDISLQRIDRMLGRLGNSS
ncbi:hypothetical protein [Sphingomonas sp.]|uniref:hypothetical protein n=1 Tax=Sphingomonas sp. TaxID=28214 RepID=UPI0025F5B4B4|nr:hypothetical protein [Sphingomonas sp.]